MSSDTEDYDTREDVMTCINYLAPFLQENLEQGIHIEIGLFLSNLLRKTFQKGIGEGMKPMLEIIKEGFEKNKKQRDAEAYLEKRAKEYDGR